MLLFAPDSLAGTLLRPLAQRECNRFAGSAARAGKRGRCNSRAGRYGGDGGCADGERGSRRRRRSRRPLLRRPRIPRKRPNRKRRLKIHRRPPAPPAADPNATTVTVIVENVESASGNVNVAVCDKDLSREGCPYVREVPAQQGFVETEFKDIPPGTYAVVGYHDVNGNDTFDKLFGMPREPYALSSKAADKLVPTFADAALTIKSGENAVIIRLKRLGG